MTGVPSGSLWLLAALAWAPILLSGAHRNTVSESHVLRETWRCGSELVMLLEGNHTEREVLKHLGNDAKPSFLRECIGNDRAFSLYDTESRHRQGIGNVLHFLVSVMSIKATFSSLHLLKAKVGATLENALKDTKDVSLRELVACGMHSPDTVSRKAIVCSLKFRFSKVFSAVLKTEPSLLHAQDSLGFTPLRFAVYIKLFFLTLFILFGRNETFSHKPKLWE
eukprot:jgi/Bigna1/61400/fgenesh1_kg.21_\